MVPAENGVPVAPKPNLHVCPAIAGKVGIVASICKRRPVAAKRPAVAAAAGASQGARASTTSSAAGGSHDSHPAK